MWTHLAVATMSSPENEKLFLSARSSCRCRWVLAIDSVKSAQYIAGSLVKSNGLLRVVQLDWDWWRFEAKRLLRRHTNFVHRNHHGQSDFSEQLYWMRLRLPIDCLSVLSPRTSRIFGSCGENQWRISANADESSPRIESDWSNFQLSLQFLIFFHTRKQIWDIRHPLLQ